MATHVRGVAVASHTNADHHRPMQRLTNGGGQSNSASTSFQTYVDCALATFASRSKELDCVARSTNRWIAREVAARPRGGPKLKLTS